MLKENAFLTKKIESDTLSVEILGEIDHHSARPIREEIDRLLYLYRPKEMVLSLARVSFMDSSGLGLLMGRITLAEALSCRVKITNADVRVKRLLNLAGLRKINNLVIEEENKGDRVS